MKNQILFTGLVFVGMAPSLHAMWPQNSVFHDLFQSSERMMQEMRHNIAKTEELAKMCHQRNEIRPDYTLQHYDGKEVYGLLIKLNGQYGTQAPKVTINASSSAHGAGTKELEVETVLGEAENATNKKNTGDKESYACQTQSSTTVMRNGVVSQQVSDNSRAVLDNGVLRITHSLPENIDAENYTMSFDDGQLKLEFSFLEAQPKAEKKALLYSPK